jgi:hypothetical protein
VTVSFINDAWAPQGPAYGDRNLYVETVRFDGSLVTNTPTVLYANSGVNVAIPASAQSALAQPALAQSNAGSASITMSDQNGQSYSIDPSQTGTVTQGDAQFILTQGNNAQVTLGAGNDTLQFVGMSSVTLTSGSGYAVVQADGGNNQFTAGSGTLDVTGGAGADAYIFHQGDGLLTIEDFSFGKGDTLTVDQSLAGSMHVGSDNQGGTMITFGSGSSQGIDLAGVSNFDSSQIHFA